VALSRIRMCSGERWRVSTREPRPESVGALSFSRRPVAGIDSDPQPIMDFAGAKDEHSPLPTCPVNVVSPEPRLSPRSGLTLLRPRKSPARAGLVREVWDRLPTCPNFQTRVSEFGQCAAAAAAGGARQAIVALRNRRSGASSRRPEPRLSWPGSRYYRHRLLGTSWSGQTRGRIFVTSPESSNLG
jgi:hypothetical protein